jgi:cytochrome oxidase assembly protein ShyY1
MLTAILLGMTISAAGALLAGWQVDRLRVRVSRLEQRRNDRGLP